MLLNLIQKSWKEANCTTPYQDPGGLKIWWQVPEKWRIWMNCPNENNWLKAKVQPSWEISILCPNFRFRPKLRKSYRQVKESSQLKRELGNFLKNWDKNVKSGVSSLRAEYTSQSEKSNIQKSLQKDDFKLFFPKIPHLGTF